MIIHVVLFQPKKDVTAEQRHAFGDALRAALTGIPEVSRSQIGKAVDVGTSYESKLGHKTYEYVAVLEFADLPALRRYLDHPIHEALGVMFWQTCESTMILDADTLDVENELFG